MPFASVSDGRNDVKERVLQARATHCSEIHTLVKSSVTREALRRIDSGARSLTPTRHVSEDRGPDPPRQATNSDRVPLESIQFATDLLRHCVTRSHRSKETGASEPKASHRIASHHQATQFRTIPPPAMQFATKLLRHCVTRSHRSTPLASQSPWKPPSPAPVFCNSQLTTEPTNTGPACHGWH